MAQRHLATVEYSMPYDLFISYSPRDNARGQITELVERMQQDFASFEGMQGRELHVFFDLQEIHGMSDWRQARMNHE